MASIDESKRIIKRAILANITTDKKDLAITPLISGKHGIGKSQIIKSVAEDLGGICITIEGGTLKEGEITGLPYQYKDDKGNIKFKFLPYYAVERIQEEEKRIYLESNKKDSKADLLLGDENRYSNNDIPVSEKIDLILNRKIRPVIVFIDEINRTENTVYKELMNILLTRSVNGYEFPWWVFFIGAMNPSTQMSVYATNEMDPAQLDRFLKINVREKPTEWLQYAKLHGLYPKIIEFINDNNKMLSSNDETLEDEENPTPSPRGWDMVDTLIKSVPLLTPFFTKEENDPKVVAKDMKSLISAKIGGAACASFITYSSSPNAVNVNEILNDDESLSKTLPLIKASSTANVNQTCDMVLTYLIDNYYFICLDKKYMTSLKKKLALLVKNLEPSTKLLFGQKLTNSTTDDGTNLIDDFFDIFDEDLLNLLDLSDDTKKLIEESK